MEDHPILAGWKHVTALIVIIAPAVVLLYDVGARYIGGYNATITAVVRSWSHTWPELPWFAAGLFTWLWLHLFASEVLKR